MKKYTETKSKAPFDWFKALSKDCKDMNEKEVKELANKSRDWVTCACGNQCAIIPRGEEGIPVDKKLHTLGSNFHGSGISRMENAMYNYFDEHENKKYLKQANTWRLKSIDTLTKIEARSKELIEDEVYKLKYLLEQFGYKVTK